MRGLHLPRIRNSTRRLPPQFLLEQTAVSRYRGATVTLNRRMAKKLTYIVAYTAGRTLDDASDFDEQPLDPLDARKDWARSRQHQLHRFTASALFELPLEQVEGIIVAPIFTYGSGRPINALATTDLYRTGAYPISARPAGLARNPNLGPGVRSLDLRVFKQIPVKKDRAVLFAGAELFNLLNHTNSLRVSAFHSSPQGPLESYLRPVEIMNARQVQLFLALEF